MMETIVEKKSERTLIEQLKSEVRRCSVCGLEVRHPLVGRCPRCFNILPQLDVSCQGCHHQSRCPIPR